MIFYLDRGCLHLGDHSSHTGDHHRLAATVCQLRRIQGAVIIYYGFYVPPFRGFLF